jgi:hypothetical protein
VFRSRVADIFELPNPAPYVEARGGACRLRLASRDKLLADCAGPATLVRRESFDAGWRARIDGAAVPVARVDELFQAIPLAAGRSEIRFQYAPPAIGWAAAGAALALAGLGAGLCRGLPWRARRF